MSYIFLNNKIVKEEEAFVSTSDRGFLFGDGLFETLRSYSGHVFKVDEHVLRMQSSANALKIPFDYSGDDIKRVINDLITKNELSDAYIRITLSRGAGVPGAGFRIPDGGAGTSVNSPTFIIFVKPLTGYPSRLYIHGMSLVISKYQRSVSCPVSSHKSANFLTNILARDEASQKGADEVIILNSEGAVAECSASNLFIVENGDVITPPLNVNILPGITRKSVLDICSENGTTTKEEAFGVDRLMQADECFITNSLMEIMPVSKIEDSVIGKQVPGRLTECLMRDYRKLAKGAQVYPKE